MKKEKVVLTIGTFDGVHLGHKKVIDELVNIAKVKKIKSVVVTFDNIPKDVILNTKTNRIISSEKKKKILYNMGVDVVKSIRFTKKIQKMTQEEFLNFLDYSIDTLIVGHDFHFGKNQFSINLGEINIIRITPFIYKNKIVSSSLLRDCLINGYIDKANKYMGRVYEIEKRIVHGEKIGRTLGYPTFNIDSDEHIELLKKGVYISRVNLNGNIYDSITNIGNSPTFDRRKVSVETFIFDFDGDIYGEQVCLNLLFFIREEIRFESKEELVNQVRKDIEVAKNRHLKGFV